MTSASELFYNRRSRFGRNSDPIDVGSGPGSPQPPPYDREANRRNHARRDRHDFDGCYPLRRAVLHHSHRQPSVNRHAHPPPQERDSIRFEEGGRQFSSGNVSHSRNQSNVQDRMRFRGNDRLPGTVLLARERLLQRLRGVTLSGSRRSNRSSSSNNHSDIAIGDDFRLVDAGDWETEISGEWLSATAPSTNQEKSKRPPGLTQEALNCLHVEVFHVLEESAEEGLPKALRECTICLDSYLEGDKLVCLPCGHRYHFCCLDPWVRTCGDCPYCRRGIDVTVDGEVKETTEF